MNQTIILGSDVKVLPRQNDGQFYVYELCTQDGKPFYVGKGVAFRWNFHEWRAVNGNGQRLYV